MEYAVWRLSEPRPSHEHNPQPGAPTWNARSVCQTRSFQVASSPNSVTINRIYQQQLTSLLISLVLFIQTNTQLPACFVCGSMNTTFRTHCRYNNLVQLRLTTNFRNFCSEIQAGEQPFSFSSLMYKCILQRAGSGPTHMTCDTDL